MTLPNPIVRLSQRLAAGDRLIAGWSSIADPALAETLVREGFDVAVLDMQHGAHTLSSAQLGIAAVALAGAPTIVRIPVGAFATASRLCDMGAAAIIAPMINTVEDAEAFARFVKYPPLGSRSWGPFRAVALTGLTPPAYLSTANAVHLALPMIETRAALDVLDAILAAPGIDGVFVGPSDLSLSLLGDRVDPTAPVVEEALDHIAARAKAAGKVAGMFCFTGAQAQSMGTRGFALCSVASDGMLLGAAARAEVKAARG